MRGLVPPFLELSRENSAELTAAQCQDSGHQAKILRNVEEIVFLITRWTLDVKGLVQDLQGTDHTTGRDTHMTQGGRVIVVRGNLKGTTPKGCMTWLATKSFSEKCQTMISVGE